MEQKSNQSEALERARQRREEMKAAGVEVERLDPIEKAKRNPQSRRYAINAKCWDCSCGQRAEIRDCAVKACPLYNFRPYQKGAEENEESN